MGCLLPPRAPASRVRGRALRPLGAVPPIVARALGAEIRVVLLARGGVLLRRLDALRQRPEVFFERELPVGGVLQDGDAGEVDRRATRLRAVAPVLHVDDDAAVVTELVPLVR